jgi:GT2 family glycosyltransferase
MSNPIGVGNAKHRFHNFEGFAEGAAFPVFKKEAFKLAGMYDESLDRNQDDELNYRLNELGYKIYISPIARSTYYVRDSPKELFKQYFDYGYWRMAVIRKHKIPVSLRQLAPPVFFILVLLFIIFCVLLHFIPFFCAFILPAIYIFAIFTSAIIVIKKNGIRLGLLFPIAVVILHFAYAAGFLKGLKFLFNKL